MNSIVEQGKNQNNTASSVKPITWDGQNITSLFDIVALSSHLPHKQSFYQLEV